MDELDINYICSDNKVHIRFRDYDSSAVIAGFEHKLTYLLTYLMNYSYMQQVIVPYDTDMLIANFLQTADVSKINACIRMTTHVDKYKGIKLRKNYKPSSAETYKPYGKVCVDCFPEKIENGIIKAGDLNFFLAYFNISLAEYLFNDNYVIILSDLTLDSINKKFINKMNKKLEAQELNTQDLVELW